MLCCQKGGEAARISVYEEHIIDYGAIKVWALGTAGDGGYMAQGHGRRCRSGHCLSLCKGFIWLSAKANVINGCFPPILLREGGEGEGEGEGEVFQRGRKQGLPPPLKHQQGAFR